MYYPARFDEMLPFRRSALPASRASCFGVPFRITYFARNISQVDVFETPGKEFSSLALLEDYKKYSSHSTYGAELLVRRGAWA
jgi:hypothetical protein